MRVVAALVGLAMTGAWAPAPLDTSLTIDAPPREVATHALGDAAAHYADAVVVEFPVLGDPPPNVKPFHWEVEFMSTPQAAAPGLCGAEVLDVSVEAVAKVPPGQPEAPKHAVRTFPARVFRVVESLGANAELESGQSRLTQAACDRLRPIGAYFLNGDDVFPGDRGAFSADDAETAWAGARLLQRAAELDRRTGRPGFEVTCVHAGSRVCNDPRLFLSARTLDDLIDVRTTVCAAGAQKNRCFQIGLLEAGRICVLKVQTPGVSAEPRSIGIECDERNYNEYPWYVTRWIKPKVIKSD